MPRFSSYRYSIDFIISFIIIEMTGLNFSYSVNNTVSVPVFHKFAYCQSKISYYFPVIIIGMHSKLHRSWPELQRQAGIQRAGAVVEGLGANSCRWGHPGKQLLPPSPLPHSLSLSLTSYMHTHMLCTVNWANVCILCVCQSHWYWEPILWITTS